MISEGPRRAGMLERKVAAAEGALEDLKAYAEALDSLLGWNYVITSKSCLKQLRMFRKAAEYALEFYRNELRDDEHSAPEDATTFGMVQLYWFFRHGCDLSGDESEVRTALIRSAFWTHYGVLRVDVQERYETGQSKGCEAVRLAVRRFRLKDEGHRSQKPR
jgi:hypothetical protein